MPDVIARVVDVYPYRVRAGAAELLLLRRAAGRAYAGEWRVVGGKIEPGEAAWQAGLRETVEETGRRPLRFWTLPSVNRFYEWQHDRVNVVPAFAAHLDADPVLNSEHDDWSWLSADEAQSRLAWPEHRRLAALVGETLRRGVPPALVIPPGVWSLPDDAQRR